MSNSNIRALRLINNLSQEEAAKIAGVSLITYMRYENDQRSPSIESVVALAKFYNVSIETLLNLDINAAIVSENSIKILLSCVKEIEKIYNSTNINLNTPRKRISNK